MADALPAPMPRMTRNQSSSNLIPRNASNVSLSALGQRVMSSQDLVKMSELLVKPSNQMETSMARQSNAWEIGGVDEDDAQRKFDELFVADFQQTLSKEMNSSDSPRTTYNFLDFSPMIKDGVESVVKDSFTRCFRSQTTHHWNWNPYLMVMYIVGVVFRYFILFPIRLVILLLGFLLFFTAKPIVNRVFRADPVKRKQYQRYLIQFLCGAFALSWSAVVKYHGVRPPRRANQVFVANHTSLIDVIVLGLDQVYSFVGQRHVGFVGLLQDYLLDGMDCLWFNRMEAQDRQMVSKKIREHVHDSDKAPLLIFPEGTCVNNKHIVMFKRGVRSLMSFLKKLMISQAFDLDAIVCPVAIKYNKIFVDAFWNSKNQTFAEHLFRLMTSWAVVADVYYLEPQRRLTDESVTAFADRVKKQIAKRARLMPVPWDGYLKYYRPRASFLEHRQQVVANLLRYRFKIPTDSPDIQEPSDENDEKHAKSN